MEQNNTLNPQLADVTGSEGQQNEAPAPKKRKSHKTLYISLALLFVLLLAAGGYYAFSAYSSTVAEQLAYEILENNDNPQDYEDYLEKYPDSEHAQEVRMRLGKIREMHARWQVIQLSDNVNDFKNFKSTYDDAQYARLCDIKIDSLDFVAAQREGTEEAFMRYLNMHPDGHYASEASVAKGQIRDQEITMEDRDQIMRVIIDFYKGFEMQDDAMICSNITATMTNFLSLKNATKAQVLSAIKGMFNEHIQNCEFQVNRDIDIVRVAEKESKTPSYKCLFTVDQHIQRDNEGKTFSSYKCEAEVSGQLLISSLTMEELSRK